MTVSNRLPVTLTAGGGVERSAGGLVSALAGVPADAYATSRDTGSFILIDPATHQTVAGGMVREVL